MDDLSFSNNSDAQRYELRRAGALAARVDYAMQDGVVVLTHTEVLPAYDGQGLGSKVAGHALDDVRLRGLKARPVCDFIAHHIERHPEYADLVSSRA